MKLGADFCLLLKKREKRKVLLGKRSFSEASGNRRKKAKREDGKHPVSKTEIMLLTMSFPSIELGQLEKIGLSDSITPCS